MAKYEFLFLSQVEHDRADKFCEEHCNHNQPSRDLFIRCSSITFCFTPTGVGPVIVLKCSCGAEEDISDYDCW